MRLLFKFWLQKQVMDKASIRLPEPLHSLMNGLERGAVTNFYGEPGAGKTNICLMASLECVRQGGTVAFIDTEGGFSLERLRQLTQDAEGALNRITLAQPGDFREQGRVIKELHEKGPDLVILDSAVALYRLECAEHEIRAPDGSHQSETTTARANGQETETGPRQLASAHTERAAKLKEGRVLMPGASKELSRQLSVLSQLARRKGIPVLITAHTYKNWETGRSEVIGGDSLRYWSNALVFLEKTGKTSERKATLVKHRSLPEGREARFMIVDEGIKPSGFKLF